MSLLLVACADRPIPTQFAIASWEEGDDWGTLNDGNPQGTEPRILAQEADAPLLESYRTTFWAVQGKKTSVSVKYLADEDGDGQEPFVDLTIPRRTKLVDPFGNRLADGDSLLITIEVHSTNLMVSFEPHGLVFDVAPAQLRMWYDNADRNQTEEGGEVQESDLAIWYQPTQYDPWTRLPTRLRNFADVLETYLDHFSNYAVAW